MNRKSVSFTALLVLLSATAYGQLKINEVFYNTTNSFGGNQYVELYNAGAGEIYLDGLIITDEAGTDSEGIYQFPGSGNEHVLLPGSNLLIAVDATGATINADWECYANGFDTDNPDVCNLTLVQGTEDLGLSLFGDNVIIADGTVTSFPMTLPINSNLVIDGMNYDGFLGPGGGERAPIAPGFPPEPLAGATITSTVNFALTRLPAGNDTETSTTNDFLSFIQTPIPSGSCSNGILPIVFELIGAGGGHITSSWNTVAGETYQFQFTTNLLDDSTNWVTVGSDTVATTTTMTKVDSNVASNFIRAYRVRQLGP